LNRPDLAGNDRSDPSFPFDPFPSTGFWMPESAAAFTRFPIPYSLFPIPYSRIWTVEPGRCMVIATKPEIEAV
jgi:hypothetical protein